MFRCRLIVDLFVLRVEEVKYFFMYVCEGKDLVTVQLVDSRQRYDEVSQIQDAQYVFALKAHW